MYLARAIFLCRMLMKSQIVYTTYGLGATGKTVLALSHTSSSPPFPSCPSPGSRWGCLGLGNM